MTVTSQARVLRQVLRLKQRSEYLKTEHDYGD